MMTRLVFALMTFLIPFACYGESGQVHLKLRLLSERVLLGEPLPLEITLHNASGATALLSTFDHGQGFRRHIKVRRQDGSVIDAPWISAAMPSKHLGPNEKAIFRTDLQGDELLIFVTSGQYEVWAEYESPGRVYQQAQIAGESPRFQDVWKGTLNSNICILHVQEPLGVDREAYDRWLRPYALREQQLAGGYRGQKAVIENGKEHIAEFDLLSMIRNDFPTSTYAAWDLVRELERFESTWVKPDMAPSIAFKALLATDYPGAVGGRWKTGKAWMQALAHHGELIEPIHGRNPYLGARLRFGLALANISIGNYEAARRMLDDILRDTPKSDLAGKAKEYDALLKNAGFTP